MQSSTLRSDLPTCVICPHLLWVFLDSMSLTKGKLDSKKSSHKMDICVGVTIHMTKEKTVSSPHNISDTEVWVFPSH